jgi:hypothetical protein
MLDWGYLDLHFACFILRLLPTNQQPYLLSFTKSPEDYCDRYSQIFQSIIK